MKTLYLDIFSGISGDMFIGAMLDLEVDFDWLSGALTGLGLGDFHLHAQRDTRGQIQGVKFDVHEEGPDAHGHPAEAAPGQHPHRPHDHDHGDHDDHDHGHAHAHTHEHHQSAHPHHHEGRHFPEIRDLIAQSACSDWVKEKSTAIFRRVAEAEGKIHGLSPEKVHFHEVGGLDSIVDIVGACLCLEALGRPRVLAGPVVEGQGWVDCAHGRFPVPTAATLEILRAREVAVSQCEEPHELVTPTGAALLAEFVEKFGPMENLAPQKIGYGLGTRDNRTRPNVLRAILGETTERGAHDWETDVVAVLETNLDDLTPEMLGGFAERALRLGALDVFHTPVQMKKGRPGLVLTVLCPEPSADQFTELILRETSAFGVRRSRMERRKLRRETIEVRTAYGTVKVKLGRLDGQVVQIAPEFESYRALAEAARVPLRQVYEAAARAARQ